MEKNVTETTLSGERLGDESRVQAVLAGWGMDAQAVERMLDQHRAALRAEARGESRRAVPSAHTAGARPAPAAPPPAHALR
jgi:hypothetical protein